MTCDITRFYFDFDEDCRSGCLVGLPCKDIETIEADQFEAKLKNENIPYVRVDL